MIVGIDATPRVGIIGTILHRVQIEAQHPVCGYITIVGKARRLLRVENRDIDARIGDRGIDRCRGQRSLGRGDLTLDAGIRCVAASAGHETKGKEPTAPSKSRRITPTFRIPPDEFFCGRA